MKIEIVTTKKKLTKSIINQMELMSFDEFICGKYEILGLVKNVRKGINNVILIKNGNKYMLMNADYDKGNKTIYRYSIHRGKRYTGKVKEYDNYEECSKEFHKYRRLKSCDQIFI